MSSNTPTKCWAPIARLLRPQGRRGEMLSEPLCDLAQVFAPGSTVVLGTDTNADGSAEPLPRSQPRILEEHWVPSGKNAGRIVLKLSGCDSISQAEELAGQIVLLPADSMPALDSDTFYVGDLVGCAFFDGNTLIGRIVDVQFATAPDGRTRLEDAAPLLGVELLASNPSVESAPVDPILVPFVRAWLESVDLSARRIVMQLPAGLFDLPSEEAPDED
jgi:16S rRNA processing protein RimM